ncbi:MAG: carbohydrate ABC transporter permease [Hyphomicrobiales bacterium]
MRRPLTQALRWIVFAVAALALNIPVIVTLVTSFKTAGEVSRNPGLIIEQPTLANYATVFAMADRFDIIRYGLNSIAAASIGTAIAVILAFPAAYGMTRLGVGRKWLMPIVVNLRAVPLIIFAIPLYMMYQQLALLDTQLGLGLILAIVNLPLMLIMFVTAIDALPVEIEEAARLDGAGTWAILRHVVGPISRATIASTLVLGFITAWNEFLFGLILTTKSAVPVTVGASFFFAASGGGVQWGVAAAVMMLSTLPPVLIGLFLYRQVGLSLTTGAVK